MTPTPQTSAQSLIEDLVDEVIFDQFELPPNKKGRPQSQPLQLDYTRDLTKGDLEDLRDRPPGAYKPPTVQKLRDTHHALARLMASGESQVNAALITGRTKEGVWILMQDPTFLELVEYYRSNKEQAYEVVHQELANLGKAAVHELQERLEEAPESFSNGEMRKLAEFALDRTITKEVKPGQGQGSAGPLTVEINFIQGKGAAREQGPGGQPVIDLEVTEIKG